MQRIQLIASAAGDWMAGDPLATPLGLRLVEATKEEMISEDWGTNMEVSLLIRIIDHLIFSHVASITKKKLISYP